MGVAFRELLVLKAKSPIPEGELSHLVAQFIEDALCDKISAYDLEAGMKACRDSGDPFLPRTYGDWKRTVREQGVRSGRDVHGDYDKRVRAIMRAGVPQDTVVDLDDMRARKKAIARLQKLTFRQSAYMRGFGTDHKTLFEEQIRLCRQVPIHRRTELEVEIIKSATVIERDMNWKAKTRAEKYTEARDLQHRMKKERDAGGYTSSTGEFREWSEVCEKMFKGINRKVAELEAKGVQL